MFHNKLNKNIQENVTNKSPKFKTIQISIRGFPGGSDSKESACNVGDPGSIHGLGRSPGEGKSNPTPVSWPGEFHGHRRPVGYSPWGPKGSDTTE